MSASNKRKKDSAGNLQAENEPIEGRWAIGTPGVPDHGKRTVVAAIALLVLFAVLYLAAG